MFLKTIYPLVFFAITMHHFEITAQDSFREMWDVKMNYFDKDYASVTTLQTTLDGQKVAVLSPMGLEVLQATGGQQISESPCIQSTSSKGFKPSGFGSSRNQGIKIGSGSNGGKNEKSLADELGEIQKIVHIPVPGQDAVLRFNYGFSKETISLIALDTGKEVWRNNDISWSMENSKSLMSNLNKATSGRNTASVLGAQIPEYPAYYVQKMTQIHPEKDFMLVDSFFGLVCVDLKTGENKWTVEETSLGLSHILYDEESHSIITFGGNPAWLPTLPGLENAYQMSKSILRIDADSGEIIWKSNYSKNYRVKKDGGFDNVPIQPDIRLVDDRIVTNFNQIEIFDFNTGEALFETTTGKDAASGWMGYGPASEFALPVIHEDLVFRYSISSIKAFGASVGGKMPNNYDGVIEAYNINTGEITWTSEEFSRQKINNMAIKNDLLLVGFDGSQGVRAFEAKTGKPVWQYETGKKGVGTKWIVTEHELIFNDDKEIRILNLDNGSLKQSLEPHSITKSIAQIILYRNNLLVIGKKKGMAWYDLQSGEVLAEVATGFSFEMRAYPDKVLLYPQNPSDPFIILDSNLAVIGSIKKSGKRTALSWCEKTGNVYAVEGKKVEAYKL